MKKLNDKQLEKLAQNIFSFFESQDCDDLNREFSIYSEYMSDRDEEMREELMVDCRAVARMIIRGVFN